MVFLYTEMRCIRKYRYQLCFNTYMCICIYKAENPNWIFFTPLSFLLNNRKFKFRKTEWLRSKLFVDYLSFFKCLGMWASKKANVVFIPRAGPQSSSKIPLVSFFLWGNNLSQYFVLVRLCINHHVFMNKNQKSFFRGWNSCLNYRFLFF